jgi:hypothetical protein
MKVWFLSFILIFVLVQFIFWIKDFFVPLPVHILAGAFLAIASNYEQKISSYFSHPQDKN